MTNHLNMDVYVLQDLPPSNINRDDTGTPKQAIYGGARRLRVSSQAWKRATRLAFRESMDESQLGVRTRRFVGLLTRELLDRGVEAGLASRLATTVSQSLGIQSNKKKESDLAYLLFFSRTQVAEIVRQILDVLQTGAEGKELDAAIGAIDVKAILNEGHSLDVALFGRMVAELAGLNIDASVQVAHALSTHAVATDFDYFTAVDDEQQDDETGAGMIGSVEFNSATMYRYATVSVGQLFENLADRDATVEGVVEFVRAFSLSMPGGHKTSFAPRTRPGFVGVVFRTDQPVNLVSAFERPIVSGTGTFDLSLKRLAGFASDQARLWGDHPLATFATYRAATGDEDQVATAFGPSVPFGDLLTAVRATVGDWLGTAGESEA